MEAQFSVILIFINYIVSILVFVTKSRKKRISNIIIIDRDIILYIWMHHSLVIVKEASLVGC